MVVVPLVSVQQRHYCMCDSLAAPNEGEMFSNGGGIDFPNKLPDMI
jgi:hypothetical protein